MHDHPAIDGTPGRGRREHRAVCLSRHQDPQPGGTRPPARALRSAVGRHPAGRRAVHAVGRALRGGELAARGDRSAGARAASPSLRGASKSGPWLRRAAAARGAGRARGRSGQADLRIVLRRVHPARHGVRAGAGGMRHDCRGLFPRGAAGGARTDPGTDSQAGDISRAQLLARDVPPRRHAAPAARRAESIPAGARTLRADRVAVGNGRAAARDWPQPAGRPWDLAGNAARGTTPRLADLTQRLAHAGYGPGGTRRSSRTSSRFCSAVRHRLDR